MDNHRQEAGVEARRNKKISELFRQEKATEAILQFLISEKSRMES